MPLATHQKHISASVNIVVRFVRALKPEQPSPAVVGEGADRRQHQFLALTSMFLCYRASRIYFANAAISASLKAFE